MRHCQGVCHPDFKQRQRTWRCQDAVHDSLKSNLIIACKLRGRAARIQPDPVRDTRQGQTVLCQHKVGDPDVNCESWFVWT